MEKIDEKERFERDRAFYRLAWNDGYGKGIEDGEDDKPPMIDDAHFEEINSFPTIADQGWCIGYKVGYEEGVYERCREAVETKEGTNDKNQG